MEKFLVAAAKDRNVLALTLIWVGFLGVRFVVGWGKITPYLKLIKIMPEIWNLVGKYTHICGFR